MTKHLGEKTSGIIANNHEGTQIASGEGWKGSGHYFINPDPLETRMDVHNNGVGRKTAIENPTASDQQLAEKVMMVLDQGRLVISPEEYRIPWGKIHLSEF